MGTESWAVASVMVTTMLAAGAGYVLKIGAGETPLSRNRFRISGKVFATVGLYLLSSGFFSWASSGGPLSTRWFR